MNEFTYTMEGLEDQIKLVLPNPKLGRDDLSAFPWVKYNPRKDIPRWGVSLTSLDGGILGVPDLDSLLEYNKLNGTKFNETDFIKRTPYASYFEEFLNLFEVGRSHIIKLGAGGYFPFHRDLDPRVFRVIYCIEGCGFNNFVWVLNNKMLSINNEEWFYVNTKKIHSVFSFTGSTFAVFNVLNTQENIRALARYFEVK